MMTQQEWEKIADEAQARLAGLILPEYRIPDSLLPPATQLDVTSFPRQSGWFTERELEITASGVTNLVKQIASRAWSSEEVVRAFCKRAAAAQQLMHCLTDFFPQEAIVAAKALDEHLRETGKVVGPLHGLPISLKDNFHIRGKDSTLGFTSLINDPAKQNATLVTILENLGAVRYCKTNVPTAMMIPESVNNVFGRTTNPLNRSLTSGGSSGGEAALIAFGGSPLGIGTDIGGSLRIPAACTGLFTLRPSFGRFPTQGCRSGMAGQEAVQSVNGPLAKTLDDIVLYCKSVVDSEPWRHDPKVLPIPWRKIEHKSKLTLAVLWDDGVCSPTPPVKRALHETVDKLKAAGHNVLDWRSDLHKPMVEILGKLFVADGGKSIEALLTPTKEPFRPEMKAYEEATERGVRNMWLLQLERSDLQRRFLEQWNSYSGLDAIICPTTPYASTKHGKFKYVGYTGVFNIVDYSAMSFPCGISADKTKDHATTSHSPVSDFDREAHDDYDADAVHGMPISLQLVARRLEEEKVLAMMEQILQSI